MPLELYSVEQVAESLGLRHDGRLKAVRIGKQYVAQVQAILAFLRGAAAP